MIGKPKQQLKDVTIKVRVSSLEVFNYLYVLFMSTFWLTDCIAMYLIVKKYFEHKNYLGQSIFC